MKRELVGMRRRRVLRPVMAGLFALLTLLLAPLPLGPGWLWAAVLLAVSAVPWLLGLRAARRAPDSWRLSADGLEQRANGGRIRRRYALEDIGELVVVADTGMLTVTDSFGFRLFGAPLRAMGFDLLPLWSTARALDVTIEVFDSDPDLMGAGGRLPRGHNEETQRRLLALEAALLSAVHADADPGQDTAGSSPVVLTSRRPNAPRRWGLLAARGLIALAAVCGLGVTASTAAYRHLPDRALGGAAAVVTAFAVASLARVRRETATISWSISDDELRVRQETVGEWRLPLRAIGAIVPFRGSVTDPRTGVPGHGLVGCVFGHQTEFLLALPYGALAAEQVAAVLRQHGVRLVDQDANRRERVVSGAASGGLFGPQVLPRLFRVLPAGRLLIDADGLHWADVAAGERLTVPAERIGSIELRTSHGHAWLRLRDDGGGVVLHAPLAALRTSRTDVREGARRAGLPVVDREYEAYTQAVFSDVVRGYHEPSAPADPADRIARPAPAGPVAGQRRGPGRLRRLGRVGRVGWLGREGRARRPGGWSDGPSDGRPSGGAVVIDPTPRSRWAGYLYLPGGMGVLGALLASNLRPLAPPGPLLGGVVGASLLLGVAAAWRRSRSRPRLAVSDRGIAGVSRWGRVLWRHDRAVLGGVEVDESGRGAHLVLWSPSARELWRGPVDGPPTRLRSACEEHGLPWGPPAPGRLTGPPPEQ